MKLVAYLHHLFTGNQSCVAVPTPYLRNKRIVPLSALQRAALLPGLINGENKGAYCNSLQTGLNPAQLRECLDDNPLHWQIEGSTAAHGVLNFLLDEGERTAYEVLQPLLLTMKNKRDREKYIEDNFYFTEIALYYAGNLSDNLEILRENTILSLTSADLKKGALAWDMALMVFIARLTFDVGYLTEQEAWGYIETAYQRCKTGFASWQEAAKSYLIGEAMHTDNPLTFLCSTQKVCAALTDAESPWLEVPLCY